MNPNQQQILSILRWMQATVGPILISHGYVNSGTLEMIFGAAISLVPLIWGLFAHTQANAVAVVTQIAAQPESPVKAVITEATPEGRDLANSIKAVAPTAPIAAATTPAANALANGGVKS